MQMFTNKLQMWSQMFYRGAVFGLGLVFKKNFKKYQKYEFVQILWITMWTKPATQTKFWDPILIVSFVQASIFVLVPKLLGVWNIYKMCLNNWVHFHRIGPLGRFGLLVAMSVCLSVCVSPSHAFFFKCWSQKCLDVECCY